VEGNACATGSQTQGWIMGDLIFFGVGVISFALLALYVFGCGRA
jgi:hypothetical protein